MKTSSAYRAQSRASLSNRWGAAVIATLVYFVISGVVSAVFSAPANAFSGMASEGMGGILTILAWCITLPLSWGYSIAILDYYRNSERTDIPFGSLFDGFKHYMRVFGTTFLYTIYTFLWTLLLIVPGIIKMLSYSMTPYILKDRPELSYDAAIEESMRLMEGHKMAYFKLLFSYIGWILVCILTLGIGIFWVQPWMSAASCAFYEDLVAEDKAKNYQVIESGM